MVVKKQVTIVLRDARDNEMELMVESSPSTDAFIEQFDWGAAWVDHVKTEEAVETKTRTIWRKR